MPDTLHVETFTSRAAETSAPGRLINAAADLGTLRERLRELDTVQVATTSLRDLVEAAAKSAPGDRTPFIHWDGYSVLCALDDASVLATMRINEALEALANAIPGLTEEEERQRKICAGPSAMAAE